MITSEFATTRGVSGSARTVSPNSQAIRPSLSIALAPMSAACHCGRSADSTSVLSIAAELSAWSGRRDDGGHSGVSRYAGRTAVVLGAADRVSPD